MSASGVWKPNARRVISRIWVLMASTRALERPLLIAARIPGFWSVIVLASFTNGRRRQRRAQIEPALEQLGCLGGRDPVDLPELLLQEVGAEERPVGLLDPRELDLLAGGEVLGVLPEREAGVLELARERGQAFPARLVPDLAADLVERLGRQLDDVERVEAQLGVGAAFRDRPGDPGGHVARHQFQLFAALFAEPVEERLGRLAVTAGRGPHQPSSVVVDDDGQVPLPLAVADLVDPDPGEPGEQITAARRPPRRPVRRSLPRSATRSASAATPPSSNSSPQATRPGPRSSRVNREP